MTGSLLGKAVDLMKTLITPAMMFYLVCIWSSVAVIAVRATSNLKWILEILLDNLHSITSLCNSLD